MIIMYTKYKDGIWRYSTYTLRSKDAEIKYAKEVCQMFNHFLQKGNILGYSVSVAHKDENGKQQSELIGNNET